MRIFLSMLLIVGLIWEGVVCVKSNEETLSEEDDDILAHLTPKSQTKRQLIQQNVKPIGETLSIPPTLRSYKSDAASIVGDVNKYGLWEYTSDNTGMGDQIKQLMSKADGSDIYGDKNAVSLEKEAHKMNEQINKYAEASSEPNSTIDPLEQPAEMDHQSQSQKSPENEPNKSEEKFDDHGESVSVISIPSSMTIEDEHGHQLDTLNVEGMSPLNSSLVNSRHHDVSFDKTVETTLKRLRSNSSLPASKKTERTKPSEVDKLTLRLLKAMKNNASFRKKAEELLPASSDNDMQLFQKEKQIYNNLNMIEKEASSTKSNSATTHLTESTGHSKLHIPVYRKKAGNNKDVKLLGNIKQLIHDDYSSHDEEQNVLKDLLTTMKKAEKDEGKIETDFSDMGGGGNGESLSDAYLSHFKEFLQKHKEKEHAKEEEQHGETNSAVENEGAKESGHAMIDFLQKEASTFNKFHESKTNPKLELQRMEAMISKQESQEEPLDKQNEKLLHKQQKELAEDKQHSEKALNRLKAHNGDSKTKVSKTTSSRDSPGVSNEEIEVFDNSILKYIKKSQRFRQYLQGKGVLQPSGIPVESREDGTVLYERPLAEQFEEIELQKEILNLRERQLRNRDRKKQLLNEKEDSKEKEISTAKSNHKLQLTNPEREKFSEESGKEMSEIKEVLKADQTLKEKKKKKMTEGHTAEAVKIKDLSYKNEEEKDNEDSSTNSTVSSTDDGDDGKVEHSVQTMVDNAEQDDQETVQSLAEKLNDRIGKLNGLEKKKQEVEVTEDDSTTSDEHGFTKKTTEPPVQKKFLKNLTDDHIKMLSLPINNPKPEAETTLTPHADFMHSSATGATVVRPQSNSANAAVHHLSPSLKIATTVERRQLAYNKPMSHILSQRLIRLAEHSELHRIPAHAAGVHHVYPILEPASNAQQSSKKDSDIQPNKIMQPSSDTPILEPRSTSQLAKKDSDIIPNKIMQPAHSPPSQPSNLLKHKEIPTPLEEVDQKHVRMSVHAQTTDKHPTFIRPKMAHLVDVRPAKKGFGKLPVKPKEYLLKELQKDIILLDKHSKRSANKTVGQKDNSIEANTSVIDIKNATISRNVLIPSKQAHEGANNVTLLQISSTERRSNIKVEDVFNILQSEDQKEATT